jgi:hypothetical protein
MTLRQLADTPALADIWMGVGTASQWFGGWRRHHLPETVLQRAVRVAAKRADSVFDRGPFGVRSPLDE